MDSIVGYVLAVAFFAFVMTVGVSILAKMGTPLPPPPPEGELRRVKLQYRCSICGTELRMTTSTHADPEPPRHCMEDMDLLTPIEDR